MLSSSLSHIKLNWLGNIRSDLLAGMVVALALIPEAIAFSIIAGVDPKVGLYASFCIAIVISFIGARSGMISAATGAMALVMVLLVKAHGLEYLLAATILTGILQIVAGFFQLGTLIRFVSRSVVTGFVNALAILIFMAQLPEFKGAGIQMYGMVGLGLAIIYILPRFTRAVPSALVSIIAVTLISIYFGMDLRTVGDMGELPSTLPIFLLPDIPLNLETLKIIFPYSLTLMAVGLLESLMTATIVDDMTDSSSNKNRECMGQGVANIVSGFFGGMAGCAMIGQSVINIKSGGRGRLSTLFAGLFLLFLLLAVGDWVRQIPMAALVAVMIMVSIGTFNWASFRNLRTHPKTSSLVMLTTVAVVVTTHDLAMGVFVGVLTSALFFARRVSLLLKIDSELSEDAQERCYKVYGQVFFASAGMFAESFDFKDAAPQVIIDVSAAHFWDLSAVGALDNVVLKFRRNGTDVRLLGLNQASATIVDRLGVYDKPNALELLPKH
ncbi:MAG: SulP family inorganic anion transporter [Candidatus Nitrohelix vancouverensis]|uniref:SulP family inorganic anion transporter n=1 Tax=Candidatus Nitrohelix vancouverensis TaxID=2705534 RepID=A0A7T0G2Y3_9BACT|nr:MAG: SulP family inorganic anion transporter [Candidatus Nitrohelix vancouverensis]